MDTVMVHVRLPKALIKAVDHAAVDAEMSRAQTIESMLRFAAESRLAPHLEKNSSQEDGR